MRPSLALSVARILLRVPTLPSPAPTPMPEPKHRQPRRQRISLRLSRKARDPEEAERQVIVATMTNWQRTQWARAGYPKSMNKVRRFRALERRRLLVMSAGANADGL